MTNPTNGIHEIRLSPALGWPLGVGLAVVMAVMAVLCVVVYLRARETNSDLTLWATCRRTLICLLVAAMALTPCIVETSDSKAVNATDVVIATDVTGSMAVKDAQYGSDQPISRLDAAKAAIDDITGLYPDSSFSAVRFGATAKVDVPLTPDSGAIQSWADGLKPETTDLSSGSTLDMPLNQLLTGLKSIHSSHEHDTIVLYLITDGEQTSPKSRRSFSPLRQYLTDAFVLGMGSQQGGKIPKITAEQQNTDAAPPTNDWVEDPTTGKPGISVMDVKQLEGIADELSGKTVILDGKHRLGQKDATRSKQWNVTKTPSKNERLNPIVWPFAIALTVLLTLETAAWLSTSRRLI